MQRFKKERSDPLFADLRRNLRRATFTICSYFVAVIEMKMFVLNVTLLQNKIFTHHMTESEYFRYKQNWWISLNKSGDTGPLRNRSDFNQALSTFNPFTPRIWRTTTHAALLEVPGTASIIEFFLQLVAMEWFLVEFTIIQRKSINEDSCKAI